VKRWHYAVGPGYGFFLTPREAMLSFVKPQDAAGARGSLNAVDHGRELTLALRFEGAHSRALLEPRAPLARKVNYLKGDDPARWRSGLSTYGAIVYSDLWPGIDMLVRGRSGALKYEFRVAPGADVNRIRLSYRGAEGLSLGGGGSLVIGTALGPLRDAPPVSYQRIDGKRVLVSSRYTLARDRQAYGFAVGAGYDPRRPLIIDPRLDFSTFLGGQITDTGWAIAVDRMGDAYVTGQTLSPDFPTTPGVHDTSHNGSFDVFVTKLSAAGAALDYSTFIGGARGEVGRGIAVDRRGRAHVTGLTESSNFPTTPGAYDTSYNGVGAPGEADAFVATLNAAGTGFTYSTFLGTGDFDQSWAIAVDRLVSAYVVGRTDSPSFPTTPGAYDAAYNGNSDAFVTKLNGSGTALAYSTFLGGGDFDQGLGIAVDRQGAATSRAQPRPPASPRPRVRMTRATTATRMRL
jgi:Beta-propeller repeat